MVQKRNQKKATKKINEKMNVEPEEMASTPKKNFWNSPLFNGIITVAIIAVAVFWGYNNYMQGQVDQGWTAINNAWNNTMNASILDPKFTVANLSASIQTDVMNTLGSIESLPADLQKQWGTVQEIPVQALPEPLRTQMIRKYNIEKLEDIYAHTLANESTPWTLLTLSQLYFLQGNIAKSKEYQIVLTEKYANHPVIKELDKTVLEKEAKFLKNNAVKSNETEKASVATTAKNPVVEILTSKGKVKVEVFVNDVPEVANYFISLVKDSFYNGLNFYSGTDYKVFTGCPMGTGKGNKALRHTIKFYDMPVQAGSLVMETNEKENEIDTRFSIYRKHPFVSENKRHCVIGKVIEGLENLNNITPADLLLNVTVL